MVNRRNLKYRLQRLRQVKTWQLLVILFLGVLVAATLLRLNNLGMVERRDAVIAADKSGDSATTRTTMIELQRYVSSHMNTDLGNGVYLETAYTRDRDAAVAAAGDSANPNSDVQRQAAIECRARFQGGTASYVNDYVACVKERVDALAPGQTVELKLPPVDNYRYDFVSPFISFDLAGISVIFCLLIVLVIISRLIALVVLRLLLKHRFQSM